MVRRATFNLLVQLRRRTSRPYSLELEHADARRFSIPCCLERRASSTPLASTTYTVMIWMINKTKEVRDSGYPCGRLKPSPVRRRRWPDAGSRLDPPAFERAQALTLADRGSANFGEGLRHMREALTFAQPAPLPIPRLLTAFALCQKENEFACRRPLTRRRGPCGGSQPPWVGVRDPVARDAAWPPLERAQTVVGPPPQPDGVNGSRHSPPPAARPALPPTSRPRALPPTHT